jgi:hypothetical protein
MGHGVDERDCIGKRDAPVATSIRGAERVESYECAKSGKRVTSSGFGTIITQFGNPRQAMVAAKLYF